jgi:hypothetical protein
VRDVRHCFCGCGRAVPRFPLGMRSINKRGLMVAERLEWARAIDVPLATKTWYDQGEAALDELRSAMHGEADPRSLDESAVRHWQREGLIYEGFAVKSGRPAINTWLREQRRS